MRHTPAPLSRPALLPRLPRLLLGLAMATLTPALLPAVAARAADTPAAALPADAAARGRAIAEDADRRDRGWVDTQAGLTMVLGSKSGQTAVRELSFKSLERKAGSDGDKSLIVFDTPKDVKDTALLTFTHIQGNDDQWIYLPALKRVKRIASANKSGPFMGSEFAYEDFAAAEVEKFSYRWLRDEACGSLTCTVIERVPTYENSGYSRQVVWLDKGELRALKVDYYDRRGQLLKTMTAGGWKQYLGKFWRSHDMMMVNHQTGKTTRLTWTAFTFKAGLRDSDFSETALARP